MDGHVKFGVSYLLQIQKYYQIQPIQGRSFWPPNVERPNVFQYKLHSVSINHLWHLYIDFAMCPHRNAFDKHTTLQFCNKLYCSPIILRNNLG